MVLLTVVPNPMHVYEIVLAKLVSHIFDLPPLHVYVESLLVDSWLATENLGISGGTLLEVVHPSL